MVKPALGRGLGALLGGASAAAKTASTLVPPSNPASAPPHDPAGQSNPDGVRLVPLARIRPCPFQPRKDFSPESLRELADSIREKGIVQPLIVRPKGADFELIAGERRWRAAELLGLTELPVIVREADDRTVLELALIENLQRENLNPLEEALGFSQLIDQFQLTQEEAATRVGKSRAQVANGLRLLKLPPAVQEMLRHGQISVGHAKVILGLAGPEEQKRAAERVTARGLSVRETEELVSHWQAQTKNDLATKPPAADPAPRSAHVTDLENRLKQRLGTRVLLRYRDGKGSIEARFFSDAELERLLQILGIALD
jgi:ParB family chromosome partitioning protein